MELFYIFIHIVCILSSCFTPLCHSFLSRIPLQWKEIDYLKMSRNNAVNTKLRPTSISSYTSTDRTKVNSSDSSSDNKYYYIPETYEKTTQKSLGLYVSTYSYADSLTTTSTTPKPKPEKSSEVSTIAPSKEYSKPGSRSFSPSYIPNNYQISKPTPMDSTYSEKHEVPVYYDDDEEISTENYYSKRSRNQNYPLHHNYGRDLSSMQTSSLLFKSKKIGIKPKIPNQRPIKNTPKFTPSEAPIYTTPPYGNYPSRYPYNGENGNYYPYKDDNYNYNHRDTNYMSNNNPQTKDGFLRDILSETVDFMSQLGEDDSESQIDSNSNVKTASWLGPGIAGLLIGILPLASIVASFIPAFVSVPVISTSAFSRRKRQIQDSDIFNVNNTEFLNPILHMIARYGMSSLEDSNCLQEMFCTFTAEGKNTNTNLIQNWIYKLVEWTPVQWAKSMGMDTLFYAIKYDKCLTTYECMQWKGKSEVIELAYGFGQLLLSAIFIN